MYILFYKTVTQTRPGGASHATDATKEAFAAAFISSQLYIYNHNMQTPHRELPYQKAFCTPVVKNVDVDFSR